MLQLVSAETRAGGGMSPAVPAAVRPLRDRSGHVWSAAGCRAVRAAAAVVTGSECFDAIGERTQSRPVAEATSP
jgi:hypothetical protein